MKTSNFKKSVINATTTTVKSLCGTTHLALKYALDATEEIEVQAVKRLTGELSTDIRQNRRLETLQTQADHKAMFNALKDKFNKVERATNHTEMSIIRELTAFSKVSTEV
jgi:hypothetical protein